ncbi:UPF0223 family protein [Candidatus Pseudothioglobus singularis]|nr:UPF0223 family protein [Candidatus Pseudothioglobus singularis]
MNYHYPIDESWSKEEIIDVVNFFRLVEDAYEKQVHRNELLFMYNRFKKIVPSKSEEKRIFKSFEEASGYSSYQTVKKAREGMDDVIKMKKSSRK